MTRRLRLLIAAALAAFCAAASGAFSLAQQPRSHLVIVVDGLRPDMVTPSLMPRLSALARRGTTFTAHHSVFPTVTRVNASTFVTGVYPEHHGLLGNTIYIPSVNSLKGLDTGRREWLEQVAKAEGQLLTAPTLGEILERAGKRLLVVSSGSSGSALLLDSARAEAPIVNVGFVRPRSLAPELTAAIGAVPPHANPNDAQNQYAIDAYLKWGLPGLQSDVTFMWLSDPDTTAHASGLAAEVTRRALGGVDAGIGRIEDTLAKTNRLSGTNIIVTSDHGFSTHRGGLRLEEWLRPFASTTPEGSDVVVAEGAVYLRSDRARSQLAAMVAALQRRQEVGAIFTRPTRAGATEGVIPGTLSFDVARWNHARAGDILVSANWTSETNNSGFPGATHQNGVAGHGTSSPFDIHNTLIAVGPDFREASTSAVPTGNVDVAPTLLHLLGLPVPTSMTGRVILEGLRTGPQPSTLAVTHREETVRSADGSYVLTATLSTVDGKRYLDFTAVRR